MERYQKTTALAGAPNTTWNTGAKNNPQKLFKFHRMEHDSTHGAADMVDKELPDYLQSKELKEQSIFIKHNDSVYEKCNQLV